MTEIDHEDCAARLVRDMAAKGVDVTASDKRPGMTMPSGFEELRMRCPHGIEMWMEPTIEQRLTWIREVTA